jgi:hypothetical protein
VLLEYDVTGTKDQQPAYGRGSIAWTNEGQRYKVEGKAKALFFTLLNFTSVGELDAWGVSPELYTEQRVSSRPPIPISTVNAMSSAFPPPPPATRAGAASRTAPA